MTRDGIESAFVVEEKLNKLLGQVRFEDFLAMASQAMEIHEMFDRATTISPEYGQGYEDGFWAARQLDAKYQLVKMESIMEQSSVYFQQWE